jgi:Fe2+ or Zn2+ uptake regulation protein
MSNANRATEAYQVFEEARLRGCRVNVTTCISLLDALNKSECLEQAVVVGAVLSEIAKSKHVLLDPCNIQDLVS